MPSFKQQLTELLFKKKLLTSSQLKEAVSNQKREGGELSKILVNKGYVKQEELLAALSDVLNIPPLDLSKIKLNPAVFSKDIPSKIVKRYRFIPISKIGRTLTVATDDPLNIFVLDDLKIATNCELKTVITTSAQLSKAIRKYCQESGEESKKGGNVRMEIK